MAPQISAPSPSAKPQKRSGREHYLVALGVFFSVILVASYAMYQLRAGAIGRIHTASYNTATSVVQSIDGLFETIDVALLASSDEIARQQTMGATDLQAVSAYLDRQTRRIPHVAYIRGTDAKGNVIYGTDVPVPPVSLADREFFQTLQSKPGYGLFVAKPVFGKIARKYVMTLARPIIGKNGEFAGTVYASIYVEELQGILSQFGIGNLASLALRDADMGLIVRHVFGASDPIPVGTTKVSTPFTEAIRNNPNEGTYTSDATSLDPVVRFYSYKRSPKFGYLVNVGVSLDEELTAWWNQVWLVVGMAGALTGVLAVFVYQSNLSARRREEYLENVAHVEVQHRDLLENLQTGVVVHAPDTRITLANAMAAELLGLTKDQMMGKTAIDPAWCFVNTAGQVLAPSEYPVSVVIQTRKPITELAMGVRVPGRAGTAWLQVSAFPSYDASGALQQVVVNFYDTTRRKEAEDRWKFALEGSGDGIWDIDMERGEAQCSRRYYEMLGYEEGEVPGFHQNWLEHVHPEDSGKARTDIAAQIAADNGTFTTEYRIRCKNGSYKWILARGMVVNRGPDGSPLRMVGANTDISQLKAAEQNVWMQANFDTLTGLPNRRLFYDRLEMKLRQADRTDEVLALLFIDIDRFKEVNDTLGHHIGDALLIQAAQRIKDCVRDYDTVARLGGDEFTVILTAQHKSFDTGTIAQKIIDKLSTPFLLGDGETYVSASIGIALYPNDADSVNELVKNADQAMYVAKNAGRKRFCFFTKDMQESALERMRLVADLRGAVVEQQFQVYYQPIVSLATGKVHKAEALVRWQHPQRGLVSPAEFISVAEEIGAIHDIGDWVFMQAAHQVSNWQKKYAPEFQISVNKSPVQFEGERRGHASWIEQLRNLKIAGNSIVIEITEGILMNSSATVTDSLIQFRDAGIQVAVDDFGTGYSSLAYLKKFDIDYLKIDQSFVRNLSPDSSDRALCEAIVRMAHSLGLLVIAEGVETAQQRDLLKEIQCDFAQGYLYSRPVPADQFEQYLESLG